MAPPTVGRAYLPSSMFGGESEKFGYKSMHNKGFYLELVNVITTGKV
jgi:hypothetical protein